MSASSLGEVCRRSESSTRFLRKSNWARGGLGCAIDNKVRGAREGFEGIFGAKEEGSSERGRVIRIPQEEGATIRSSEVGGKKDQVLQGGRVARWTVSMTCCSSCV